VKKDKAKGMTDVQIKELRDALKDLLKKNGPYLVFNCSVGLHDETNEVALFLTGDDGVEHMRILKHFSGEADHLATSEFITAGECNSIVCNPGASGGFASNDYVMVTEADLEDGKISIDKLRDLRRRQIKAKESEQ
jgi:hypothetical protein